MLPVKVIFLTLRSPVIASPISAPDPVIHCIASAGSPASNNISVSFNPESGVSPAGFRTTAFPAAMAGPTLWQTRFNGKLNGLMAATIPTGILIVKPN
jgi:hypothetical protein